MQKKINESQITVKNAKILRKNAKFQVKMLICWAKIVQKTSMKPQIKALGPSYSQNLIEIIISNILPRKIYLYIE